MCVSFSTPLFNNRLFLLVSSGDSKNNCFSAERDEYGADTMTEINIIGRVTLNLWRVMKTEAGVPAWRPHSSVFL